MKKKILVLAILVVAVFVSTIVSADEIPLVPDGWTRAMSNPNYAFQEYWMRTGGYYTIILKLLDLNTSEVIDVASGIYADFYIYDVSPDDDSVVGDNPVVIHGYDDFYDPPINPVHITYVKRISSLAEMITIEGDPQSIVLDGRGTATIATSARQATIDLETLQEVTPPLQVILHEPGYEYEIMENVSPVTSSPIMVNDNDGNLYILPTAQATYIRKLNEMGESTFLEVLGGEIQAISFDNLNGIFLCVVYQLDPYSHHLLKVTGFTPLLETTPMQSLQTQIDNLNRRVNPVFQITSPANGATVNGTVSVDVFSNNEENLTRCYLYVDNTYIGQDYSAPFSFNWDSRYYPNGSHTIKVKGYFRDGVYATKEATITVTTDNQTVITPSISITSPSMGDTVSGTITVSTDATDEFSSVYLYVDGSFKGWDGSAPFEFELDTTALSNTSHSLRVRGRHTLTRQYVNDTIGVDVSN